MHKNRTCGVTIIELLVVIFIIGLLIAFTAPLIVNRVNTNARIQTTRQQLEQLRKAVVGNPDVISGGEYADVGFRGDVGRLPRHLIELATRRPDTSRYSYVGRESLPIWNPFTKHGWKGPYIRDDGQQGFMHDAWGDTIRFLIGRVNDTIGLRSTGPDGRWSTDPSPTPLANDDIQILF
jgi:prepilin-type N-terminal cleavage/methylation domain-containing protein